MSDVTLPVMVTGCVTLLSENVSRLIKLYIKSNVNKYGPKLTQIWPEVSGKYRAAPCISLTHLVQ